MSSDIIANLQQLKNRWLSVVSTHKIGDQLDGDFDILDEAITKLRALIPAAANTESEEGHGTS